MMDPEVMEGFICPACKIILNTPVLLTKHYEEHEKDDSERSKSFKEILELAKKKILKKDDISSYSESVLSNANKNNQEEDWIPQEIGSFRSYTKYFKGIRDARMERYTLETNKLLMRLDKLLTNLPTDPVDRKGHEKAIVPWMDDKHVIHCLGCGKTFNITRRKHHCRLCGVILCHDCSIFMSLADGRKMTSQASSQVALSPTTEFTGFTNRLVQAGVGLSKIARSPSSTSLNSVLSLISDTTSSEQNFRICQHCKNLLDARERLKARHIEKPAVHQFYEKMGNQMQDANRFIDIYYKMWNSFNEGESTYDLRDALVVRAKLAKIGDNIDVISKKISILVNIDDNSPALLKQEYRLHQMIRSSAMIFLKNNILEIPPVPSQEEYEIIKKERQEKIRARIAYEQQLEEEHMEKQREYKKLTTQRSFNHNESKSPTSSNQLILDQSQGWVTSGRPGGNMIISSTSMDPYVEQMSNLHMYIKQAKEECKFEEAATLKKNLEEIQRAYYLRQESDNNN